MSISYCPTQRLFQCESSIEEIIYLSNTIPSLGLWNGFFYRTKGDPTAPMFSFYFSPSNTTSTFVARSRAAHRGSEFIISGTVSQNAAGRKPIYDLYLRFVPSHYKSYSVYFRGSIDARDVLTGIWGTSKNDLGFTFEFHRTRADVLIHRPSFTQPDGRASRPRLLWTFALSAVRARVRRSLLSTSHFATRRATRRVWERFAHGELDAAEIAEMYRQTTYADACCYFATILPRTVTHLYVLSASLYARARD